MKTVLANSATNATSAMLSRIADWVSVKACARINNRAENSRQPTRERERRIPQGDFLRGVRGFGDPERTQAFLSRFGPIRQYFTLKRHLLRVSRYRKQLAARFAAWHQFH